MIHSHLNYGILLWGFECEKIFKLQKKAIRILTNSQYLAHTNPLFRNEKILKVEDIFRLHCYKLFYAYIHNKLPINLSEFFKLDVNNSNQLTLEYFDVVDIYGKKRIKYFLPHMINNSPRAIIDKVMTHSLPSYKFYAKQLMLNEYDCSPCVDLNCYACRRNTSV